MNRKAHLHRRRHKWALAALLPDSDGRVLGKRLPPGGLEAELAARLGSP